MSSTIFTKINLNTIFDSQQLNLVYPDTLTENGAHAHSSSGNECLDFFIHTVRNMDENSLVSLFNSAYNKNLKLTIALLMHLRDARDGKGEKN